MLLRFQKERIRRQKHGGIFNLGDDDDSEDRADIGLTHRGQVSANWFLPSLVEVDSCVPQIHGGGYEEEEEEEEEERKELSKRDVGGVD